MAHVYVCHGLTIASDLPLAKLEPAGLVDASIDVIISVGSVPEAIGESQQIMAGYYANRSEVLLSIPEVGRFVARDGKSIVVEPAAEVEAGAIELFLLGSMLGAILHQRGLFPLHCCAFAHRGGCVVLMGESGAGKSTLGALLSDRGFLLVSDDVLVVRPRIDGEFCAEPSLPILKLWPDALAASALTDHFAPIEYAEYPKHRLAIQSRFVHSALPVKRLYALTWEADPHLPFSFSPMARFDALMALRANVYRQMLIDARAQEHAFMKEMAPLAAQAPGFEFRRPRVKTRLGEQIDALLEHLDR
jgi:hypothetical protein